MTWLSCGWAQPRAAGHTASEFGGYLRGQRFVFRHVRGDFSLAGGIHFDRIESANSLSLGAGWFNFDADRFHGCCKDGLVLYRGSLNWLSDQLDAERCADPGNRIKAGM